MDTMAGPLLDLVNEGSDLHEVGPGAHDGNKVHRLPPLSHVAPLSAAAGAGQDNLNQQTCESPRMLPLSVDFSIFSWTMFSTICRRESQLSGATRSRRRWAAAGDSPSSTAASRWARNSSGVRP